jgi:hemerythrin-like domain-containing protein
MDRATQNLENDHLHILKLIAVMAEMVKSPLPDTSHLEEVVELIKQFADGLHHAKEEKLLFPLMAEKGFSLQQGPVAVMLQDHEKGRTYVKGMTEGIKIYRMGQREATGLIYFNMLGYAELLTNHIQKENNILFRMADNAFSTEEQQLLLLQFQQIDKGSLTGIPAGVFQLRIDSLAHQYLKLNQSLNI